jgi:hypothetical protein
MLAAIELPEKLCVVRWSGRVRLHVEVLTICGQQTQVEGIVQVPDYALTRPVLSVSDFGGTGRRALTICPQCKAALG